MKRLYFTISVGLLISCYWLLGRFYPDGYTHVIFCDVGQGDTILLTHGFYQVLIDGSKNEAGIDCLGRHLPWWDRYLELVIITHPDQDHIGGLPIIFNRFRVAKIVTNGMSTDSEDYQELTQVIDQSIKQGTQVFVLNNRQDFSLYDQKGQLIWYLTNLIAPDLPQDKDTNDGSIVSLLTVGQIKFLFTGDLTESSEASLLRQHLVPQIEVLKVAHHGSKNGSSIDFLAVAQPKIAVISCSKNNSYGHPNQEVLDRLQQISAQIFSTDEVGEIEFLTDGLVYWPHDFSTK